MAYANKTIATMKNYVDLCVLTTTSLCLGRKSHNFSINKARPKTVCYQCKGHRWKAYRENPTIRKGKEKKNNFH